MLTMFMTDTYLREQMQIELWLADDWACCQQGQVS